MSRSSRIGGVAGAAGLLLVLATGAVGAEAGDQQQPAAEPASVDWPVTISRLRQQAGRQPGRAAARQQLAVAYNNYGVSLGQQRQWDLAIQQLQEALAIEPDNEPFRDNLCSIYVNRAQELYQQNQVAAALEALDRAVTLNPNLAQAHALRGQIEYDRQKLKEAKAAWQRAVALDPAQPQLAERLAQVTQELPVESTFEHVSQASFDIRYEEQDHGPDGFDIRQMLLEARRSVGSDFAHWPQRKIIVLIYSAESFRALRQETPEWVGGQFDGKIRVPLPGAQADLATVKQILFHEYTHAVIQDIANGTCPLWLNEGLAEYEGRTQLPGAVKRLQTALSAQRLIPWMSLSDRFSAAHPAEDVALAYEQSYSLVAYLVQRYGFWRIRRILTAVAEGRPWEAVLAEELHMKLPKIEAAWRAWLPGFLT